MCLEVFLEVVDKIEIVYFWPGSASDRRIMSPTSYWYPRKVLEQHNPASAVHPMRSEHGERR